MPGKNSITGYKGASDDDRQLALGVTKFPGPGKVSQVTGGLHTQCGPVTAIGIVSFAAPFKSACYHVGLSDGVGPTNISKNGFTSPVGTGTYIAVGV